MTLPKPMTSGAKAEGRFGKQDFVYLPETRTSYSCPAGERADVPMTNEEDDKAMRRYWTTVCAGCKLKIEMHDGSGAKDPAMGARACP